MIITRTPYRISFFGGGTDFQPWYEEHGGDILSTSINHYNYILCRYLPPFTSEYRNRIVWKLLELPDRVEDIKHNAIRAALLHFEVKEGVEICNQSDLPARTGLGSSSSFCAGLIKAIYALKGEMISKYGLARETIRLEREILKERGGIQDQIATVYGGLNYIHINNNGSFTVEPVVLTDERRHEFNSKLLLFFTGISRTSSEIAAKQEASIKDRYYQLSNMQSMVSEACRILTQNKANLDDFGRLLHESWLLKRSLTEKVSNPFIDEIYNVAISNGALGGKILGAGGGGFILFYVPEARQNGVKEALKDLIHVPFKFDDQGSQIVLYSPKNYSKSVFERRDYIHMKEKKKNIEA